MNKGTYGYIRKKKMVNLLATLGFVVIVALLVVAAKAWVPEAYHNITLVMAMLSVLPGAYFLVQLIVMMPYRDVDAAEYEHMKEVADTGLFYTGLNITANQLPTIPLRYAYVHPDGVVAYTDSSKIDLKKSQEYIEAMLRANGIDTVVKIFTSKDSFERRMKDLQTKAPVDSGKAGNKLLKTASTICAISL